MLKLYIPKLDDYWYEEKLQSDPNTMSYNCGYDVSYYGYHYDTGCIDFPKERWQEVYEKRKKEGKYFAYIKKNNDFIGYVNYHYNKIDKRFECGIVIEDKYRGKGYSKEALKLLCDEARKNGVDSLYDNFEINRKNALRIFLSAGFKIIEKVKWKKFGEDVEGVIVKMDLKEKTKLYLASTSKWKSEILNRVYLKHECLNSDHEEKTIKNDVYEYVQDLALNKVLNVEKQVSSGIIIGLDTVVYLDDKIIEKPKSLEEARNNILKCSNNQSNVITGIAIMDKSTNKTYTSYSKTIISFREIKEEDANFYVENEPLALKVSGFVIETFMSNFINKIDGSYYNIIGVPVETIYKMLQELGYCITDFN